MICFFFLTTLHTGYYQGFPREEREWGAAHPEVTVSHDKHSQSCES